MRIGNAAVLSTVIGAVTIGMAAPAMAAGTLAVTPGQVHRGQKTTVHVKACTKEGSVAKSSAFAADIALNTEGEVEGVVGLATIASQAKFGVHPVHVDCAGVDYVGQVTVLGGGGGYPVPHGGAKTGLGGSGVNLALVGAGGVLMLAAGGVGAMGMRRRRSDAGV